MGSRPTQSRDRLTRAAAELFYERGIQRTTIDAVVERAGLSKPTLYQHFGSKDDLIEAAIRMRDREYRERLEALMERHTESGEEAALASFDLLSEWMAENPGYRGCSITNAAVELPDPEHNGRTAAREHKLWLRTSFEEALRAGGCSQSEELAQALFFLLEGARVSAYVCDQADAGEAARRAARVLIRAHLN